MCRIAGIVDLQARLAEPSLVRRLCDVIAHRGPDDEGYYIKGPVTLGQSRLAIQDLAGGRRPMRNEDGTVSITFNGKIYSGSRRAALRRPSSRRFNRAFSSSSCRSCRSSLLLACVKRRSTDAQVPADVADRRARLDLAEGVGHLLLGEFRALHQSPPVRGGPPKQHFTLVLTCRHFRGRRQTETIVMPQERTSWDSRPTVRLLERPDITDIWPRGYFHLAREGWDGATWVRNYDELRRRDLAVFALGDVRGRRVLDVACGDGLYMIVLGKMGARVSGQDISPQAIVEARQNLVRHGVDSCLEVGDAMSLRFGASSFDAVLSADFVEHITDKEKAAFFAEVFRVLKPGGVFVIKTPNLSFLHLSLLLKRCKALLRGGSPFGVHIEHTHSNPDCQHHGLTTRQALSRLLLAQLFHSPTFVRAPLSRRSVPAFLQEALPQISYRFSADLIVSARKPVFVGYFP
jgi:2-polyprenyl-3-methyl-5-hydroxy-6-metoxy-1,4-benzoquinol methylase